MKKVIMFLLLAVIAVGVVSCKSEQSKGEDLIDEYMKNHAYDYDRDRKSTRLNSSH